MAQYVSWPAPVLGYSRPLPAQITDTHTFREYDLGASHLRSFYAWLLKRIQPEDFISPWGTFYPMAWDQALMFPMLEMAGPGRSLFLTSCIRIMPRLRSMTPRSTAPCNDSVKRQSVCSNHTIA
jgi:hypothetical protein